MATVSKSSTIVGKYGLQQNITTGSLILLDTLAEDVYVEVIDAVVSGGSSSGIGIYVEYPNTGTTTTLLTTTGVFSTNNTANKVLLPGGTKIYATRSGGSGNVALVGILYSNS